MKKLSNILTIRYASVLMLLAVALLFTFSSQVQSLGSKSEKELFFEPVINQLAIRGVSKEFIDKLMNDDNTNFNEKLVKINVISGMTKSNSPYEKLYNAASVKKSKSFLEENDSVLTAAQDKFGVPKEIITSLLWIETKHGDYLGNNHLPSVFLSVAMAGETDYKNQNIQNLTNSFDGNSDELPELLAKLNQRTKKKVDWALNELVALEKLDKVCPKPINKLYGSWAGAFGMPQFLPSSYLQWAVDGDGDGKIDLFNKVDAIHSVANYLKTNGWKTESPEAQRTAVFHYNNSTDYVNAVLTLAEKIKI